MVSEVSTKVMHSEWRLEHTEESPELPRRFRHRLSHRVTSANA